MVFDTPKTKQELKEVLKEIYDHYVNPKDQFEEVELEDLTLEKLEPTIVSEEELESLATDYLALSHQQEIEEKRLKLSSSISALNSEKQTLTKEVEKLKEDLIKRYELLKESVTEKAIKQGIINSTLVVNKLADIEKEKANKLADIEFEYAVKISSIDEKITALTLELTEVEESFTLKHFDEIKKKKLELKESYEEKELEVLKYNNQVEERLVKYRNSLNKIRQDLYFEYLKIKAQGLSEEQLVAAGYYSAVIKACNAYYYTLSPQEAYSDFLEDEDMPIYLGRFYANMITLYTTRLA